MDVFTMVVVIVAIACTAGVAEKYFKARTAQSNRPIDEDVRADIDRLRERVEVLEKIVTDERYDLEQQINRLERQA